MFLTLDEIEDLTERKRKADQVAWLRKNRVPFLIGANGHPRVSREFIARKLGGGTPETPEPNFAVLDS